MFWLVVLVDLLELLFSPRCELKKESRQVASVTGNLGACLNVRQQELLLLTGCNFLNRLTILRVNKNENPNQIQLRNSFFFWNAWLGSRSLWFWCNAMKYQIREEICKNELERESKGEWIIGFMILFLLFTVYTAQPAKDGIKPQPVYQVSK